MLTLIAGSLAVIGTISGAVWTMEGRYAHQIDLVQHFREHTQQQKEFNLEILESRRQAIHREVFQMQEAQRTRTLTPNERRYLDELLLQERETQTKMDRLSR